MNQYLSKKIRVLSLISMVLVVYQHIGRGAKLDVYTYTMLYSKGLINTFTELTLVYGIAPIAVPLFFLISGYLFYRNVGTEQNNTLLSSIKEGGINCIKKYHSRFWTLFVPFCFWQLFWILVNVVVIAVACKLGKTSLPFQEMPIIKSLSTLGDFLLTFFIKPQPDMPLWYVRDLMCLALLSPIIYAMVRLFPIIVMSLVALFYFTGYMQPLEWEEWNFTGNLNHSVAFFVFGSYLAIHSKDFPMKQLNKNKYSLLFGSFWFLFIVIQALLIRYTSAITIKILCHQAMILFGVAFVWTFYDNAYKIRHQKLANLINRLLPFTFIIYVMHSPLLQLMSPIYYGIFGKGSWSMAVGYFIMPIITILLCIKFGCFFSAYFTKIYSFATGKR